MLRSLARWMLLSAIVRAIWAAVRGVRLLLLGGAVISGSLLGCGPLSGLMPSQPDAPLGTVRVIRVADGDTITVADGEQSTRVRLLGIDSPEISSNECGARQAKARTVSLLSSHPVDTDGDGLVDTLGGAIRRVRLQVNSSGESSDQYGRLLAYVYLPKRPVSIQEILVRDGLATVFRFHGRDLDLGDRLDDARLAARRSKRGVWGQLKCGGDFHSKRPGLQR